MYSVVNEERTYGVEIEFFGTDVASISNALIEKGIDVQYEGYTHRTTSHWKIVTDSSVNGLGLELVSPVLKGEEGMRQLKKVCEALEIVGAKVDRSCGLHIHLGATDLTLQHWKNILVFYNNYQRSIDKMLPRSRRRNTYCRPYTEKELRDLFKLKTLSQLEDVCMDTDRYKVINICSFLRHGTIEFRQHSGTIEFEKISQWLQFCMGVVEKGKSVKVLDIWRAEDDSREFEALMRQIRKSGASLNAIKYFRERKEKLA